MTIITVFTNSASICNHGNRNYIREHVGSQFLIEQADTQIIMNCEQNINYMLLTQFIRCLVVSDNFHH